MHRIETALVLSSLFIAAIYPSLGSQWFDRIERTVSQLAQRRALSVAFIGIAALLLRISLLPVEPIPKPVVHDEFGYLLAADTFAHGRLTNPTPPMWEHFETFSILMKPTYQCFAPPAQGMVLALGRVVLGHPFWGVWLSVGMMCGAITWMLQGWLSAEWAILGGALAVLRFGVFSYWADSYWGGAIAAIGGALVLGALPRIKEYQRLRDALLLGLGLAILANSRPYEGLVLSLPVAVILFVWMTGKKRPPLAISLRNVILPSALMLLLGAVGTGYYFWRVTGSPIHMPYQVERQTYGVAPFMAWQHVRPIPEYHHAVMQRMYVGEELNSYRFFRSFPGLLFKAYVGWSFFLGVALSLPLIMLLFTLPRDFRVSAVNPDTLTLIGLLGISFIGCALETFYNPHYSSPATALVLGTVLLSMKPLRKWSSAGLFLARAIPLICILSFCARALAGPLQIPMREFYEFAWYQKGPPSLGRADIEGKLVQIPGRHLVIVRYLPDHKPFREWVYNAADIDQARIVWAREMDSAENQRLLDHFKDRQKWLLEPDQEPPKLVPYSSEAQH